jgi:UDP-4-amino-4,6-dideoxy-N-acetyl-beta-L-altrosamine N-acetyltransferase
VIALRDVRPSDEAQMREWRNRPEVARFMLGDHQISEEEHHRWFQGLAGDPRRRYWIITCDGIDVGVASVNDVDEKNGRCSWTFYIADPAVRGKGVGTFVEYSILRWVFEERGLNKLCGEVLSFNEPVLRMHRSFGFHEEGVLHRHVVKDGRAQDITLIAFFRSDWEERKPEIEMRLRERGLL